MNLQLQKDNSFNRSFERENGYNFCFVGPTKLVSDFSLNRGNSINRNGSINMGFNPYKRDGKQPVNLFVELADEDNNDRNNDFMHLNILQKNASSVRPTMFRDKSFNSSFSLNVNTGNENLFNPTPIKPKFEDKPLKLTAQPSIVAKEALGLELDTTNDKTKNLIESPELDAANIDCGDMWVRSQSKVFVQNNYNWNQEVEGLLEDTEEELNPSSPAEKPRERRATKAAETAKVNIRRHRKKSKKQLETLESHFDIDTEWSLDLVERLASDLGLEKDQVYKWNWDKRKRLRKAAEKASSKQNKRQKTKD